MSFSRRQKADGRWAVQGACVLLMGWLALSRGVAAQQPAGAGVIEGRVVMLSSSSTAPLGNLPASLFTFINGARQIPPAVGQTDAQGRVRFENLQTGSNYTYTLIIKFQDAFYRHESIAFATNSATAQAEVKVYDSSADMRALRVDQHHVIVELDSVERMLNITEIYLTTNISDRVLTGAPDSAANGKRVSFRVPLPPDAILEAVEERQPSENIFLVSNQLLDTVPMQPGENSFIFSYRLPYQRSTVALGLSAPFTTTTLSVLASPNITVRAPRFVSQGTVNMGTLTMQRFTARDVAAGSSLAIELNNLPAPLIPIDIAQWAPLVVVTLALMGVLLWSNRRHRATT